MTEREELRKLAVATKIGGPGVWDDAKVLARIYQLNAWGTGLVTATEFIAAANPTAVLDLLDQCDAAESKLAEANRSLIELKPDPVLVEDSWIPADELATVCGNFMRSSREFASQIKAAEAKLAAAHQLADEGTDHA